MSAEWIGKLSTTPMVASREPAMGTQTEEGN